MHLILVKVVFLSQATLEDAVKPQKVNITEKHPVLGISFFHRPLKKARNKL